MKFTRSEADIFVPDATLAPSDALKRTTHLCVAAHQDDIEIMAYQGIAACFGRDDKWFSGVVVTNGAGSPRSGPYRDCTDEAMQGIRRREQRKAAYVGDYSIQLQLAHPSAAVKAPADAGVQADLAAIFAGCAPEVVYLHQPADKHDTHIAVLMHCLKALRALPAARRPKKVLGCEVWRDLDWMCDSDKHVLDTGAHPNIAASLVGVFDSQIVGGKRYDLATAGRRLAHATYHTSHATDVCQGINWAMDLTPLVEDPAYSISEYTLAFIDRFRQDVDMRLRRFA
ncbi:PIG-L family deacetylase [Termitidicoccus mucosus]|uniref:GlcNAc-PI de-N-acetylase n=1 Tax=Termitidicoccus mucosus TaxID=1184151 RepID=A0A178IKR1_9BACT|nr:GlcNAc-PI de-N-acetylase [Opitutaceae bacterium TSB47]